MEEENEMSDIEIAELANKELQSRDAEISKLKKELAKAKLYSVAEDDTNVPMTRQEALNVISDNRTTNYDYAEAVIALCDNAFAEGEANPLGKNGQQVYDFLKDVIEECGDDKSRFCSIYQARLGADDMSTAMSYNSRNRRK